jgi:hypothetical protein
MRLTPPKNITFWIAVILVVLGVIGKLTNVAILTPYSSTERELKPASLGRFFFSCIKKDENRYLLLRAPNTPPPKMMEQPRTKPKLYHPPLL